MQEKCIICGGSNLVRHKAEFVPFLKERMFGGASAPTDFVHCKDCGVAFAGMRPTDAQMAVYYDGYRGEEYQKQRQKHEPAYTPEFNYNLGFAKESFAVRKKLMFDAVSKHIDCSKVATLLDYGGDCGQYIPDEFTNANKYVYEVSGVVPVDGVKAVESRESLKDTKWDLIMCCHVLEHLSYPMEVLNEIVSIMPVGGYLYIEVPREEYFKSFAAAGKRVPIHEHINFYRTETFRAAFSGDAFEILFDKYVDVPDASGQIYGKHLQALVKKVAPVEKLTPQKLGREIELSDSFNTDKSIKDNLDIFLVTYNRGKYLERTLSQLFAPNSPVRDFEITIFDNKSTDNTAEIIAKYQKQFPSLKHVVNTRNIGGNANIAKAFAEAKKQYLWVLCDDDYYDWSAWREVENAIRDDADLICLSRYLCPGESRRYSRADLLVQMTFVPAAIHRASNFTDTTLRNIYDAVPLMFAQVVPVAEVLANPDKKIYVVQKQIVENGLHVDNVFDKDENELRTSYTRGNCKSALLPQTQNMCWLLGFASVCGVVPDKQLVTDAIKCAINFDGISASPEDFFTSTAARYSKPENWRYFLEIYFACNSQSMRAALMRQFLARLNKAEIKAAFPDLFDKWGGLLRSMRVSGVNFCQKIFSIKNQGRHKVVRFLGIKISLRRRKKQDANG